MESLEAMVGSPPPMMYRSPSRTPSLTVLCDTGFVSEFGPQLMQGGNRGDEFEGGGRTMLSGVPGGQRVPVLGQGEDRKD